MKVKCMFLTIFIICTNVQSFLFSINSTSTTGTSTSAATTTPSTGTSASTTPNTDTTTSNTGASTSAATTTSNTGTTTPNTGTSTRAASATPNTGIVASAILTATVLSTLTTVAMAGTGSTASGMLSATGMTSLNASVMSLVSTPTMASNSAASHSTVITTGANINCTNTIDYSKNCTQNPKSYYIDGVCYSLLTTSYDCAGAAGGCQSAYNGNLAVIRSADVAVSNALKQDQNGGNPNNAYWVWIQEPNNDPLIYPTLNNTSSSDGQHPLIVSQITSSCVVNMMQFLVDKNVYIQSYDPTATYWVLCENVPKFEKKGCEQALNRGPCTVASTTTSMNATDCGIQCGLTTWCAGFNYNGANQICEILNENMQSQPVICDPGWVYYERL